MSSYRASGRRILRGVLALTLVSGVGGLLSSCSSADADAGTRVAASTDTRLGELAQTAADTGSLGVIVRVDRGSGKPVEIARQAEWTKADHRLGVNDRFRMASNTKTVVATLILQLVAEGEVELADPVETWLPGAVGGGRDITVKMLLNHTSGLGDYLLTPEFLPTLTGQKPRAWRPGELLAITPPQEPPSAPGEKYAYSNANYAALGLILEKATGESLTRLIEQRITGPLEMNDSFLASDAGFGAGKTHATGYEPGSERLRRILAPAVELPEGTGFAGPERPYDNVDTTDLDPSWAWAAGGMVSTARDWQRFQTALMSGKLLPKAQLEQMRTMVTAPEEGGGYGLGLMKVDSPCGTVWGHTGGEPGYASEVYTDTSGRRSVAVLTTTNFGSKEAKAATANKALVDTAVCTMLGKPLPA
ncbi:serine hydrolase domain-containing protein [Streptomyces sp. NPDC059850]|uniref:serine hydrolase domain-containing protein n=1 Tax=Streptomyces sp. NPDC059850 TaxID=3346970 RepID=UPI0036596F51